jgi:hypothetical protein
MKKLEQCPVNCPYRASNRLAYEVELEDDFCLCDFSINKCKFMDAFIKGEIIKRFIEKNGIRRGRETGTSLINQ